MPGPQARSTGDASCGRCAGVEGGAMVDADRAVAFPDTWQFPDALIQMAHAEVSHATHQYAGRPTPHLPGWRQRRRDAEQPGHTRLWPWRTMPVGVVGTRWPYHRPRHRSHPRGSGTGGDQVWTGRDAIGKVGEDADNRRDPDSLEGSR